MPVNGSRFRARNSVVPIGNRTTAGRLDIVDLNQKVLGLYQNILTLSSGTPAIREKTWDEIHPGPPYLTGGPFTNIKITRPEHTLQGNVNLDCGPWNPTSRLRYKGSFYDPLWIPALDNWTDADFNGLGHIYSNFFPDLTSIGSGAYARLRPQLAHAGLGQAIAEIRDLPKMLKTTAGGFSSAFQALGGLASLSKGKRGSIRQYGRMLPKSASNQFVNQQFGWVPFLNDLRQCYDVYQNAGRYKAQISRANNTWQKRKRVDNKIESRTLLYTRNDIPGCQPYGEPFQSFMYVPGSFKYTIHLVESTDVWYEGTFKYYRPEFDWDSDRSRGPIAALQREMAIYGADLNPVLVWKVTPWSWLADWVSNAGDAVQRAQDWATDALVSKYMYLMHHKRRSFELRSIFTTIDGARHEYVWYRSAEAKRRQDADTPFQFSLAGGSLSPRQIAILAAIGISRS